MAFIEVVFLLPFNKVSVLWLGQLGCDLGAAKLIIETVDFAVMVSSILMP